MNKKQKGFTLVETLLVIFILVIVGFGGYYVWQNNHKTKVTITNSANTTSSSTRTQPKATETQKATTQVGISNLTAYLPTGWNADSKICDKDTYSCFTKTVNGTTYVLGFMYKDVTIGQTTGLTVNDYINPYESNAVIKTVTTSKGTTLYAVKSGTQTEGKLVVSSTKPSPTNSVVPFGAYKLGISIGRGTGQSIAGIDFSSNGASEITDDFVSIVSSLNL